MAFVVAGGSISPGCLSASICSDTSPDQNSHRTRPARISSAVTGQESIFRESNWGLERRNCSRVAVVRAGLFPGSVT